MKENTGKIRSPDGTCQTGMIAVYWRDLTPAKQAEILTAFGDNCNYDLFPIVEISTEEVEE